MEIIIVSAGGSVLLILVTTLAVILFKKHSKSTNNCLKRCISVSDASYSEQISAAVFPTGDEPMTFRTLVGRSLYHCMEFHPRKKSKLAQA